MSFDCCFFLLFFLLFFFNDTATTEIYTLSLHDALPICSARTARFSPAERTAAGAHEETSHTRLNDSPGPVRRVWLRSEEHTSELQSRRDLVCRLLLEKKKKKQ